MTREVTLAAAQFACGWDIGANLDTAERLVREAAGRGAQIVLLQELFATRPALHVRRRGLRRRARPLGPRPLTRRRVAG
jgi:N-carbamoylputrescine amidase